MVCADMAPVDSAASLSIGNNTLAIPNVLIVLLVWRPGDWEGPNKLTYESSLFKVPAKFTVKFSQYYQTRVK